jgi:hypothetical protein
MTPETDEFQIWDAPSDPSRFRMWGAVICGGLALTIIIVCALWAAI